MAAALAGGSYLYLHTPATPQLKTSQLETSAAPALGQPAPPPGAPYTAAPPPTGADTPGTSSTPSATPALPHVAGSPTALPVAPFGTSEEVFEAGARLYALNCASCHGRPGANGRGPTAAQFWDPANTVGLQAISRPSGALYQATVKGNLAQGMPSYGQRLTDTQIWDLALLLKSAHDDLPDPVMRLLHGGK